MPEITHATALNRGHLTATCSIHHALVDAIVLQDIYRSQGIDHGIDRGARGARGAHRTVGVSHDTKEAWVIEALRRDAQVEAGEAVLLDGPTVFKALQSRLSDQEPSP